MCTNTPIKRYRVDENALVMAPRKKRMSELEQQVRDHLTLHTPSVLLPVEHCVIARIEELNALLAVQDSHAGDAVILSALHRAVEKFTRILELMEHVRAVECEDPMTELYNEVLNKRMRQPNFA